MGPPHQDFLFDYIQYQFYQILADCKFKTRIDIINSFLYLDKIELDAFKKHFFDIVNNMKHFYIVFFSGLITGWFILASLLALLMFI